MLLSDKMVTLFSISHSIMSVGSIRLFHTNMKKRGIFMRVDKDKLAAMLAKDDEALWKEIRDIAKSHGFNLPESAPPHSEMEKLRMTASDGAKVNIGDAVKILNTYRRGKK